jgi:hypothetical protein
LKPSIVAVASAANFVGAKLTVAVSAVPELVAKVAVTVEIAVVAVLEVTVKPTFVPASLDTVVAAETAPDIATLSNADAVYKDMS